MRAKGWGGVGGPHKAPSHHARARRLHVCTHVRTDTWPCRKGIGSPTNQSQDPGEQHVSKQDISTPASSREHAKCARRRASWLTQGRTHVLQAGCGQFWEVQLGEVGRKVSQHDLDRSGMRGDPLGHCELGAVATAQVHGRHGPPRSGARESSAAALSATEREHKKDNEID